MTKPEFLQSLLFRLLLTALAIGLSLETSPHLRANVDTLAKQALITDYDTHTILLEKNADELMQPSSMSKLMTLYMLFEQLHEGNLLLNDTFAVSERAWRTGGSKMFVALNSHVTVSDLLRGIIVQSGNDACVVVAENLAETEEAFAERMTTKARQIGLERSTFRNSSGWPILGHLMTARDIVTLARRLITDFPEYYYLFREMNFTYNGIRQGNRNPLLYRLGIGADGLKTGHSEEGGYGLVASAIRDNRRVIIVLNGLTSAKQRAQESERLVEWAFHEFTNVNLFAAGTQVTVAEVWLGSKDSVPLVTENDISITLPRRANKELRVTAVLDSPVPAPIYKGSKLATLIIEAHSIKAQETQLIAGDNIEQAGLFVRLLATARYILRRWSVD